MCYKQIILIALCLAVLDGIFLSFFGPFFGKMVKKIQGSDIKLNIISTLVTYCVMVFQIYYFVIKPKISLTDSFLLGFTTYAIFDLTNFSIFKNYDWKIAAIDSIWGGTLYTLTNYIVTKL